MLEVFPVSESEVLDPGVARPFSESKLVILSLQKVQKLREGFLQEKCLKSTIIHYFYATSSNSIFVYSKYKLAFIRLGEEAIDTKFLISSSCRTDSTCPKGNGSLPLSWSRSVDLRAKHVQ